jgi:hypothetical protein
VVRYPEPRSVRRLLKRQADARKAEERLAERMARIDPRTGEDRRKVERRTENLSGADLEARLREVGREDTRRNARRKGGDRRRR